MRSLFSAFVNLLGLAPVKAMSYPVKDSSGSATGSVVTPSPSLPPGVYTFEVPANPNGGGGPGEEAK